MGSHSIYMLKKQKNISQLIYEVEKKNKTLHVKLRFLTSRYFILYWPNNPNPIY